MSASSLIPITVVPNKSATDNLIGVSGQLFAQFHLNKQQDLNLLLGKNKITVKIKPLDIKADELQIPENLLTKLCLPEKKGKFLAQYDPENRTLQLGPVIGLLADIATNNMDPLPGTLKRFCEELHQLISENGGLFYVFSADHLGTAGYYFDNEKWLPAKLPLPDVIYNRASRRLEQKPQFAQFRKRLEELSIPLFNDRFFSKWEVYRHLIAENQLLPYLPETTIFSKQALHDFALKYETVFIKPIHGSQGRNITKLIRSQDHSYSYQTSTNHSDSQLSLDDLYQHLKPLLGKGIYIIQQGLPIITHESNAMDFRVLCHKNQHGHWTITSVTARVGANGEFVSNLARGGVSLKPLEALRTCVGQRRAEETMSLIKELSLETAETIDRHSPGITGELGIDIGLDQSGKPWLIEVNSKPSKSFEDHQGKIRPSAKAIIEFSTKLAFDS